MKAKYKVQAITLHDGQVAELRALGIPVTTTNDVQDKTEFEVELTQEEVDAVCAHPAVFGVTAIG
ncbi:MAG: hypothetical protein IPP57_08085 [Candidatus Obscuribacter sp.]|jgi:hypothetical protein|nr:hypothetical protein [Candidatus Obscuribacter sp.]MDQ5967412.1 hypothetical protein [Cyanobacteriota bacterium erpe_2018_sw_39hr_WHONDRS-SW48-000098_B_bin.30]MBK7840010.1 hypothetical protein [Candidatus Obscuribacter sp.]MBK9203984.1 hypothetical protein [Candidatus Obscuribacter sp.]MBK9621356.1 hypothetical protein [Candidatus Obscuribacter sp.]